MLQINQVSRILQRGFCRYGALYNTNNTYEPEGNEPMIPPYEERYGESLELKKARLLYQSRKRGMLENGLLLSTFAAKYLKTFNENQAREYDRMINLPSNDWDIFYWATGVKPTPEEFNTPIMKLFKEFIKNNDREMRIRQPDLETA